MSRKPGGISIFLAVTFLCLIVFVMSIVEVTRIQILRAQAERMVISATQSVLAGYDSALKNEYGLFARNPDYGDCFFVMPEETPINQVPMAIDFAYYLQENATQTIDDVDMSLVDQLVYGRNTRKYFAMAPLEMMSTYVEATNPLHSINGVAYVKQDMVDYMEMRLPLIALKPILESFGAAEKLGKTTEFIEGKNQKIEKAASIESLYLHLYRTIDGVLINENTGAITIEDTNYVNKLIGSVDKSSQRAHMPLDVILVDDQKIYNEVTNYQSNFNHIHEIIPNLTTTYEEYMAADVTYNAIEDDAEAIESKIKIKKNKVKSINLDIAKLKGIYDIIADADKAEIASLEHERAKIEEQINDLKAGLKELQEQQLLVVKAMELAEDELYNTLSHIDLYQSSIDDYRDRISQLVGGTDSYLATTNEALSTVEAILIQGQELSEDIDVFLSSTKAEKDNYITSTYEQSILELKAIRSSYSGEGEDFKIKNNLGRIQGVLTMNKTLLEKEEATIDLLTNDYNAYLIGLFKESGIDKTVLWDMLETCDGPTNFYENHLMTNSWINYASPDSLASSLMALQSTLEDYSGGDLLDYSGYTMMQEADIQGDEASEQGNHLLQVMKSLVEQYSLSNTLGGLNPTDSTLPEGLFSDDFMQLPTDKLLVPNTDYDIESYKTGNVGYDDDVFMEAGKEAEGITLFEGVKEQLLINEYAVGMFRSFPDGHRQEVSTLSGYDKSKHQLETELEYIYTGIKDSDLALRNVAIKIFGIRVAFNSVHLATDGGKRTIITNIATMVAGWWTAGVGTLILSLIIGLLWATIESLVDIKLLLQGESVPLLKTNLTWYTGIEGMADLLIDTSIDVLTEVVDETIDIAVGEAKELLGDYETKVTEEVSEVIDQEVTALFKEARQMAGLIVEDFEKAFYQVIDEVLLSYQNESVIVSADDYFEIGSPEHTLLNNVINYMKGKLDEKADHSYETLLTMKTNVMDEFQVEFEKVQALLTERVTAEITSVVDEGFEAFSEEIDVLADEGREISADFIRLKMSGYKDQLSEKTKTVTSGVKSSKSKLDMTMMIPSVQYEVYVRLFMMMNHNDLDNRVLRMVDLIDYNLAVKKAGSANSIISNEDLMMSKYVYGITGSAEFRLDYMFMDLPLSVFKSKVTGDYHTIKVKAVNHYE